MTYTVFLDTEVHATRRTLPGHVRQRIRRAISGLSADPRPAESQPLDAARLDVPAVVEFRRLRLDAWRLVYAVNDADSWVWVLAIRQRPPHDYEDLAELLRRLADEE